MRKIIGLTIAAILVIGLVAGGTLAYFSDTETTTNNTFTAGTLDLDLGPSDASDSVTATWVGTNMCPDDATVGDDTAGNQSEGKATLLVNNDGSIDGFLDLSSITVTDDENVAVVSEAETNVADPGDLSALIDIWMFWDVDGDGTFDAGTDTAIYGINVDGTFANATKVKLSTATGAIDADVALLAGADTNITLYWRWPSSGSDNDAQGDKVTFSFTVELDQTAD